MNLICIDHLYPCIESESRNFSKADNALSHDEDVFHDRFQNVSQQFKTKIKYWLTCNKNIITIKYDVILQT